MSDRLRSSLRARWSEMMSRARRTAGRRAGVRDVRVLIVLACVSSSAVHAQQPGQAPLAGTPRPITRDTARVEPDSILALRRQWYLPRPTIFETSQVLSGISPGLSIASPTGYGAQWGDGFVAIGYQQRTRFTRLQDGAIVTGVGLGDRARTIGAELALTSFGTVRTGIGTNSTVSAKLHRSFADGMGVALGMENIFRIGGTSDGGPDGGRSVYVAVSRLLSFGSYGQSSRQLLLNVGLGTGRFRRESAVQANRAGVNIFASAGYRFAERYAMIADLTGQDLNLALSAVPSRCVPAVLTIGLADLTRSAGDGARLVLGLGLGLHRESFVRIRQRQCLI